MSRIHDTSNLNSDDTELYECARDASLNARAEYSHFKVGAAVRTRNGTELHSGCNVEEASYSHVVHAEQAAISRAVFVEGPDPEMTAIALYADAATCPPCGSCRQLLCEFDRAIRVVFPLQGKVVIHTVGDLLPVAFELS
jgi:cytidine deaminase